MTGQNWPKSKLAAGPSSAGPPKFRAFVFLFRPSFHFFSNFCGVAEVSARFQSLQMSSQICTLWTRFFVAFMIFCFVPIVVFLSRLCFFLAFSFSPDNRLLVLSRFRFFFFVSWRFLFLPNTDSLERRVERAMDLVQLVKLNARQVSEGQAMAQGERHHQEDVDRQAEKATIHHKVHGQGCFGQVVQSSSEFGCRQVVEEFERGLEGVGGGPSGMTCEHLKHLGECRLSEELLWAM